jgi:arsenate reductase (thioredoxin)
MSQIRVLFLCTGNSARSIIAEALLRSLGGVDFDVHSAGTHPKGINPFTVKVLQQASLEPADFRSKSMDEYLDEKYDYVITICDDAAEECPIFPGDPNRIHWSFTDPAAVKGTDVVKLAAFQQTLREMRQRLEAFVPVARRAFART